ncbi:heavy metal translocating P-type ATPase [Halarchaeum nitratireducens]|uniref:Heavy metal translocating P-type ATPase n=1 Tax=Halarchaeum nitratireducens TaxID=489913 RepID=A0A830GDT1_9EURY|nr:MULTISPECIES: heavy metal translocating P-type ATPase [Halarchaeum]MBP2251059.1 Cu2+-exporting ATPase [Halarchaeum solikamskense]GGN21954.1 heavy metal translocating P-type ATPase [Halarchaeum nitratireducens]
MSDQTHCTLCDLPTPDPPVTADGVEGAFCCRGCLEVARTLDDAAVADADPEDVRAAVRESANDDDAASEVPDGAETAYFSVEGMHCATCEAFLESRAADADGVHEAAASYANDALKVVYDPEASEREEIADAFSGYGYRVADPDADAERTETLTTGVRLLAGGFFGMMVMLWYVVFLYPLYLGGDPLVPFFDPRGVGGQYLFWNVAVLSGAATAFAGYPIFRGALVSLRARRPNMDLLVALAAGAAFVYSLAVLVLGGVEVYFDIPVVITLAVTAGEHWETKVKSRASAGLAELTADSVDTATVVTADGTEERALDDVEVGDRVVVSTGERVPLDGTIADGDGAVDESLLTGESNPREVDPGDDVVGGSVLVAGGVTVAVTETESTMDRIVATLWEAQSTHGGVQHLADRIAGVFVPAVLALAGLAFVAYLVLGSAVDTAVLTALTVLVVSCPCALGLATPLAVSNGIRSALARGVVVTGPTVFERGGDVDVVAFDKTGTLTTGDMRVRDVVGDEEALDAAAALERYADHPVAGAVCAYADTADDHTVADVERHATGVSGTVDGERVLVGRPALFESEGWTLPNALAARATRGDANGLVPIVVGTGGVARAIAVAGDEPRTEWTAVVDDLAATHRVIVLTGDESAAADRFRDHPGVDEVFAGVPPEGKTSVVDRLRTDGTVAMVGDGTNDAPALAAADLGVAIGDGTAMAVDAADAVITSDSLDALPALFGVARATRRRTRENLAWAFCYNALAVPLALVGLLNPLVAAAAMGTSSLLVVANSARALSTESRSVGDTLRGRVKAALARVGGATTPPS